MPRAKTRLSIDKPRPSSFFLFLRYNILEYEYEYDTTTVYNSGTLTQQVFSFCRFISAPAVAAKDTTSYTTVQTLHAVIGQSQMAAYTLNESRHAPFELSPN